MTEDTPDQNTAVEPRRHIPVWQLFSLMFTGRYKKAMGVIGYIGFVVLISFIFFWLHFFDLIDVIKNWTISIHFIKSATENILYFIIGAVSLGAPYFSIKAIYEKLIFLLAKNSEHCMLSLAMAMPGLRSRTKLHVALTVALILLCFVSYIIFVFLPYPLYRLCKYWDRHESMVDDVSSYSFSYFEDDLRNWFSWKEPGKRAGASMVETAIADALLRGNEDPEAILGDFPTKTVLRVWRALLVPGRVKNRGKLLLPLMESEELLKKALARMSSGKSRHKRPIDDEVRRKQQKRVSPVSPKWVSSIVMIFASALICAVSLGILCLAWDKWLCILLVKRSWLILACTVFAGLLPFPKIRYLVTVLLPIIPIMIFGWIQAKPFVLGEAVVYSRKIANVVEAARGNGQCANCQKQLLYC